MDRREQKKQAAAHEADLMRKLREAQVSVITTVFLMTVCTVCRPCPLTGGSTVLLSPTHDFVVERNCIKGECWQTTLLLNLRSELRSLQWLSKF